MTIQYMRNLIIGIILVVSLALSSPYIYRYYQFNRSYRAANILVAEREYGSALVKLREARGYWDDEQVNNKIQETIGNIESETHYSKGSKFIDEKLWDDAIISLSKVSNLSNRYEGAQIMIGLANSKRNEKKIQEVKGVSTNPVEVRYVERSYTPTLKPLEPTMHIEPTQAVQQNYDSICNSKKDQFIAEIKGGWNNIIIDLENKLRMEQDKTLYDYMSYKIQEQKLKVGNCFTTCSPVYFRYCLDHQGNTDEFNMGSECSSCSAN